MPRVARAHPVLVGDSRLLAALDGAIGLYHGETARHCDRVSRLARRVGKALGLDVVELEVLEWAGLLHDLGNLGVPAHVLGKLGPLDESDWVEIKRHPVVGADLLLALSPDSQRIAAGIRSHHERWDGSGYPDGLAGDAIPLSGRIITLADVFDAMTSARAYRSHVWSDEEAIEEIQRGAGTCFDPGIVPVFLELQRRDHTPLEGTHHRAPQRSASSPRAHLATSLAFGSPLAGAARGGAHAQGHRKTDRRGPVPPPASPTRGQLGRVAVVAALAGVAATLMAVAAFAVWRPPLPVMKADRAAAIALNPGDAGATSRPFGIVTSDLAPGDTVESVVHLKTNARTGLAGISLTTTANPASALTTDTVDGLQMRIERCPVAWTQAADGVPSTYSCAGTASTALADTPVIVSNRILSHLMLAGGADNFLRVTLSLPDRADHQLGGKASTINYAFSATVRTSQG